MRAKHSPSKAKAATKGKKVASLHIPLWSACAFTFSVSQPEPQGNAQAVAKREPGTGVSLPQEMIDYIIDFLHDDTRSLTSCAAVCRTFVETSRYHLFGTFHIKNDRVLCGVLDRISPPTANRAIRTLCLGTTSVIARKPFINVSLSAFEALVTELPLLSHLYVLNVFLDFDNRTPTSLPAGQVLAPKALQYLWLYKVNNATTRRPLVATELFSILRFFSAIETLNFSCGFDKRTPSHVLPYDANNATRETSPPTSNIHSLKFCSSTMFVAFIRAVRTMPTAHSLRSLEICAHDRDTLASLGELLHDLRHSLTDLTVDCRSRSSFHIVTDADAMRQALNIPHNLQGASSLRTMRFKLHMSHEDVPLLEWHWQFVVGLIGDTAKTMPDIECCVFLITVAGYYPLKRLEAANWQAFDRALQHFKSLRRIFVGSSNSSPFDWRNAEQKKTTQALHGVFANMLPAWKTKGVLLPLGA